MSFESFSDLCRKVDRILQIVQTNPVRSSTFSATPVQNVDYVWPEIDARTQILSGSGGAFGAVSTSADANMNQIMSQLSNLENSLNQIRLNTAAPVGNTNVNLEQKLEECRSGIQNLTQTTGQLVSQGNESIGMVYEMRRTIETLTQENIALRTALQQLLSQGR